MEEIKTQAIVLKSNIYKESDKLLTLFSLENGKIVAMIKGVLKPKAKLAFASQPFCFGEFNLVGKNGFFTVTNCSSNDLFFDITKDIERYYYGATILEICDILVKENEANVELFILLLKSLKLLAYDKCEPLAVVNKFIIDALKFSGYKVNFDKCCKCQNKDIIRPFFSFAKGSVLCMPCSSREASYEVIELSRGEYAILKLLGGSKIDDMSRYKFQSKENLLSCLKLLINFFEQKVDIKVKAIDELFKMIK